MTVPEAIQLAVQHHRAGRLPEAEQLYRQVLAVVPNEPACLHNLGQMAFTLRRFDIAVDLLQRACAADPRDSNNWNTLAATLFAMGRTQDAEIACRHALQITPRFSQALANLGNVQVAHGDFDGALSSFRQAIAIDASNAYAHDGLGATLLMLGDLQQGWREQEWRWLKADFEQRRFAEKPRWEGQDLTGKTLLIAVEQGYGDVFHFARYAPLLAARGARVIVEIVQDIRQVMTALPGVELLIGGDTPPPFDYVVTLMSVPLWFGTTLETIPAVVPYLFADATSAQSFATLHYQADRNRKVGLVWAGRPTHGNNHNRSMPLSTLKPLAAIPGITFYSLQKGDPVKELEPLAGEFPIVDLSDHLPDFSATAAAIAGLDLVITVDTAVAHLAGAMGKPVWVLLPFIPDWRWLLHREDSPWYPTLRLFRQKSIGAWDAVVQRVVMELTSGV